MLDPKDEGIREVVRYELTQCCRAPLEWRITHLIDALAGQQLLAEKRRKDKG